MALRGPPGPMGYTGRPGPLVSELDVKVASLLVCAVVDNPVKEPGRKLTCFLGGEMWWGAVGCALPRVYLLSLRVSLGALA